MTNGEGNQQGIFDFDSGNLDGYQNLQREQETRLKKIRQASGLPVGKWVGLKIKGMDGEITGKLELRSYPEDPGSREGLELRINHIPLTATDIESCVLLDEQDF